MQQRINLEKIIWESGNAPQFSFTLARLDLLHPVVSGNKIFKLKYNLELCHAQGKSGIITMGGAYSNHLAAAAFACKEAGLSSIGLIRGETDDLLNPTLQFCRECGMQLISISRSGFQRDSTEIENKLIAHPDYFFVPEGGDNEWGEKGCKEILPRIQEFSSYTHLVTAIGTGTTCRGLLATANPNQTVLGIPVLRIKTEEQESFIHKHLSVHSKATKQVLFEYAGKGYGKKEDILFSFMNIFFQKTGIPLDFVYTAKTLQAVIDLFEKKRLTNNDHVLVFHTGGLQGNKSLPSGTLLY